MQLLVRIQEELRSRLAGTTTFVDTTDVDLAPFNAVFYRCLDELSKADDPLVLFGSSYEVWSQATNRAQFLEDVLRETGPGLLQIGEPQARRHDLLTAAIELVVLGEISVPLSVLERAELRRATRAWRARGPNVARLDVSSYLRELALVDASGEVTSSGQILAQLVGADALVWLLANEVERSLGPTDSWRLDPSVAARLHRQPSFVIDARSLEHLGDLGQETDFPQANTRARLQSLGLLVDIRRRDEDGVLELGWELTRVGRRVLTELLADPPGPLVLLARASRDDLRDAIAGVPAASGSADLAFARLFAHELRNTLVPLRAALDQLSRQAEAHPGLARPLERARTSVRRLDTFAERTAELVAVGTPAARPVEVTMVVQEALGATQVERNGRVRHELRLEERWVLAPRERFVTALVNLIRNAAAAATGSMLLRIETTGDEELVLALDDDGPGVPTAIADRLFEDGVSGAGGTGQGLAIVRQVIEREMGGAVRYRQSDRGGARFELVLPTVHPEA